jgi:4-hydroxymandelate oxidase
MPETDPSALPVTVAEFEPLAAQRLGNDFFHYVAGAAGDESDFRICREFLDSLRFVHRILRGSDSIDTAVALPGGTCRYPVLIGPTAYLGSAHPEGEVAMARASRDFGTTLILSTLATTEMRELAQQTRASLWLQLYIYRDRKLTQGMVERAQDAGFQAIVLTVDQPVVGIRYRDRRSGFKSPKDFRLQNVVPREAAGAIGVTPQAVQKFLEEQRNTILTWKDLDWLKSVTRLPLYLKGVLSPEDAKIAVGRGVSGIIVSNHGGRQLDGLLSPIAALPAIRAEVGPQFPLLVDGGIRSGSDVLRGLCLGANAVLIGRPAVWGLAVGGSAGVSRVLEILAEEIRKAMSILGVSRVADLGRQFLRSTRDPIL